MTRNTPAPKTAEYARAARDTACRSALELLRQTDNIDLAAVLQSLLLAIVDDTEALITIRELLTRSLAELHTQRVLIARLRDRIRAGAPETRVPTFAAFVLQVEREILRDNIRDCVIAPPDVVIRREEDPRNRRVTYKLIDLHREDDPIAVLDLSRDEVERLRAMLAAREKAGFTS